MKRNVLPIICFLLLPSFAVSKQIRTFKVYMDVSADDIYKDEMASYVRTELRKNDDVIFVDVQHARYIIEILIVSNQGGIFAIHSQVVKRVPGTPYFEYPAGGSVLVGGHFEELEASVAASLNEDYFEKLREQSP